MQPAVVSILVALFLWAGATTALADDTVPSFTESPGCSAHNGYRGPFVGEAPYDPAQALRPLSDDTEIRGPWADYFGRSIADVEHRLVEAYLPGLAKPLSIHERVVPAFERVLANLAAAAEAGRVYEFRGDTWSYSNRTVPQARYLSFHSVGAAIDINASTNPYSADNELETDMPMWFVEAWREAGWCWGGDWVSVKDPMHFSWMGPVHSPLEGPGLPPYPAGSPPSSFDSVILVDSALQASGRSGAHFAVDIDRDGAADIVRLEQSVGSASFRIESAVARHRFETCAASRWADAPTVPADSVVLGDLTADGRPEVWFVNESDPAVAAAVYEIVERVEGETEITGTPQLSSVVTTEIPGSSGAVYLVGDHDRDAEADIYVIRPGRATELEVWSGPDYGSTIVDKTLAITTSSEWRFGLGDHDLDGIPDLYALSPDGPASLVVVHGGSGFTEPPRRLTTGVELGDGEELSVEDYDGDGRDDLYLIDRSGSVRIVLGGVPTPELDLDGWFVDVDSGWAPGGGCSETEGLSAVSSADAWGLNWVRLPPLEVAFRALVRYLIGLMHP